MTTAKSRFQQQRLFARTEEKKAVKTWMARSDEWDTVNEYHARRILADVARGVDVQPFFVNYARNVAERLKLAI